MRLIVLQLIKLYQRTWTRLTPKCVNTELSCSEFGFWAISEFGFRGGIILTAERIKACGKEVPDAAILGDRPGVPVARGPWRQRH